ncbi:MAG: type I restriction-modification system subunit M [Candidatus Cloacimonetes bacterium]|nr:type I restriction-modification system subunit M [Candidatus Cloacimonadota bacterium]
MSDNKRKLEQKLWDIANTLRGNMGADEFRDYILGFIFYKFLSENIEAHVTSELKVDNKTFSEAMNDKDLAESLKEECIETLGYFIEPKDLFHNIASRAKNGEFIIEDLAKALKSIEEATLGHESEEEFSGLFEDVDLSSSKLGRTVEQKNKLISAVIKHLYDDINFKFADTDSDILGDAYEYLIGKFASGAGKKAGEFYTPQQVSKLMAKIVTLGKDRISSVYDPTCGSGSLLLRVGKECKVADYYGQELNTTTYNLARMNMILHGVKYNSFDIQQGDTLEEPRHKEDIKFEAVVANPPFSAHWLARQTFLSDSRFSAAGKLAPKSKADYAFVLHMLSRLSEDGTMTIVLPHGVLFRGAAEGVIRKYLIKDKNWLDAVIGLPANIFYGTSIPAVVLVFKKCREITDILFIDASSDFEKETNQNILRQEDIERIFSTYKNRVVIDKYSYKASLKDIKENDYNLNIPRYVDTFEEEEPVDLDEIISQLSDIETEMKDTDQKLKLYCEELGIEAPVFEEDR